MDITFITIEDVIVIHERMIEIGGGSDGIHDITLLYSAIERPKAMFAGRYMYSSIWHMAGTLLQSLVKNHPFVDGNKRTAFFSALRFLNINSINIDVSNEEIVTFVLAVDVDNLSVEEIGGWFKKHEKKY